MAMWSHIFVLLTSSPYLERKLFSLQRAIVRAAITNEISNTGIKVYSISNILFSTPISLSQLSRKLFATAILATAIKRNTTAMMMKTQVYLFKCLAFFLLIDLVSSSYTGSSNVPELSRILILCCSLICSASSWYPMSVVVQQKQQESHQCASIKKKEEASPAQLAAASPDMT